MLSNIKFYFSCVFITICLGVGTIFGENYQEVIDLCQQIFGISELQLSVSPINAGLTNKNYKVIVNGQNYFVRLGCSNPEKLNIDRKKEFYIYQLVQKENIVPELIFFDPSNGNMIAKFIHGTPYGKMNGGWLYDREIAIEKIVKLIKKHHQYQKPISEEIDYPFDIIYHYLEQAHLMSVKLPSNINEMIEIVQQIKKALPPQPKVLCHQDLFADNFIYDKLDLYLVDWEYAEWSDPFYDLASLCVEQQYDHEEKEIVLFHYFGEYSEEQIIHLEMMCMLYSMKVSIWALNQNQNSVNKTFDLKWLSDLHYCNFFSSLNWLRKYAVFTN